MNELNLLHSPAYLSSRSGSVGPAGGRSMGTSTLTSNRPSSQVEHKEDPTMTLLVGLSEMEGS